MVGSGLLLGSRVRAAVGGKRGRMDTDNISTNNNTGKNTEDGIENHRLTISKSGENALISMMDRVNDGFTGGKVNRNNLANWVFIRFSDNLSPEEIKEIRSEHVDEFAALDAVMRRAKLAGKLPPELRAYLQREIGLDDPPKKKSKKNLQADLINDDV